MAAPTSTTVSATAMKTSGGGLRVGIPAKIAKCANIQPGDQIVWTWANGKVIVNVLQRREGDSHE